MEDLDVGGPAHEAASTPPAAAQLRYAIGFPGWHVQGDP
jgi:uncharacterized protein YbjT (DUF2867 family)